MLVRRMADAAHQSQDGGVLMLMLDWARAFDSVKPAALCHALARFGLPPEIIAMIAGIYSSRAFTIRDHSGTSSERADAMGGHCARMPAFAIPVHCNADSAAARCVFGLELRG